MIVEWQYIGLDDKSMNLAHKTLLRDQSRVTDIFESLRTTLCIDTSAIQIVLVSSKSTISESDATSSTLGNRGYSYGVYKDNEGKQVNKVYVNYDTPYRKDYIVNMLLGLGEVLAHQLYSEHISNNKWHREDNLIKSGLATYIAVRLASETSQDMCRKIIQVKEASFETVIKILDKRGHLPNSSFKLIDSLSAAAAVGERLKPGFIISDMDRDTVFVNNMIRLNNLLEATFIAVLNHGNIKREEYLGIIMHLKMCELLIENC